MLQELKQRVADAVQVLGEFALLSVRTLVSLFRRPPHARDVLEQLDALGVQSLGILIPTGLFIGMAITLLLQAEMDVYGAKVYIGRMLAVAAVRELGPVIAGLMLAGRVGARISAELGAMRVTQQIDSLEGLGQDPVRKLVAPRLAAMLVAAPALTVITDFIILIGGFWVTSVSPGAFWFEARKALVLRHLSGGLLKPFVFGWIITSISCFLGLRAAQGVRGVGAASASAVVTSSVVIFLANYVIGFVVLEAFGV